METRTHQGTTVTKICWRESSESESPHHHSEPSQRCRVLFSQDTGIEVEQAREGLIKIIQYSLCENSSRLGVKLMLFPAAQLACR
jgi:hypothetical protein